MSIPLKPVGSPVKRAAILKQLFDAIQSLHGEFLHLRNLAAEAIIADRKNFLLDLIEQNLDVALFFVGAGAVLGARSNDRPQEILFAKDLEIICRVARRRHECEQVSDGGGSADLFEKMTVLEELGQRDEVDRLVRLAHIDQHREDPRVRGMMEVFLADLLLNALVQHPPRAPAGPSREAPFPHQCFAEGTCEYQVNKLPLFWE